MQTEKIIAALDAIAGAVAELSAMFSSGPVQAPNPEVNAAPAKPSRVAKPAAKAAKVFKPEAPEVTIDEVREKMKELIAACGADSLVDVLAAAGAAKLSDVDTSEYGALLSAAQVMIDESGQDTLTKPTKKVAVKGPTLEDVKAMAGKLIEADKPAYLKVMAQIGKPSDMEPSGYASAIQEYEAAMPSDDADLM